MIYLHACSSLVICQPICLIAMEAVYTNMHHIYLLLPVYTCGYLYIYTCSYVDWRAMPVIYDCGLYLVTGMYTQCLYIHRTLHTCLRYYYKYYTRLLAISTFCQDLSLSH